ncbi:MAG: hypothetical protein QXK37_02950 [Candidatus Woesearchaeota archaeon]
MVSVQLSNYIAKEMDRGFSEESIRKALLNAKYSEQEINEAFMAVKQNGVQNSSPLPFKEEAIPFRQPQLTMPSSRSYIFFTVAAIIVVVLGAALIMFSDDSASELKTAQEKATGENTSKTIDEYTAPELLIEQSERNRDPDCVYSIIARKYTCLAAATDNISYCNELLNDELLRECVTFALTKQAIISKDEGLCNALEGSEKIVCRAVFASDKSLCSSITDQYIKSKCLFFAPFKYYYSKKDVGLCSSLPDLDRKQCEAIILDDGSKCLKYFNEEVC